MGFELIRIRFLEKNTPVLQLMVDTAKGGISTDQCADISVAVSAVLDVEDPIKQEYTLEISSPGIDRPLTRQKDFIKYCGQIVKIETHNLINGRKRFKGRLLAANDENILIENNTKEIELKFNQINEARLVLTDDLLQRQLENDASYISLNADFKKRQGLDI